MIKTFAWLKNSWRINQLSINQILNKIRWLTMMKKKVIGCIKIISKDFIQYLLYTYFNEDTLRVGFDVLSFFSFYTYVLSNFIISACQLNLYLEFCSHDIYFHHSKWYPIFSSSFLLLMMVQVTQMSHRCWVFFTLAFTSSKSKYIRILRPSFYLNFVCEFSFSIPSISQNKNVFSLSEVAKIYEFI